MDFELIPNEQSTLAIDIKEGYTTVPGTAVDPEHEKLTGANPGLRGSEEERLARVAEAERALSEFTFSDNEEGDERFAALIDLTVPVTYRVKFNFTPEK